MPPELVVLLPLAVMAAAYATLFVVEVLDEWRYRRLIRREATALLGEVDGERLEILHRMPELLDYPCDTLRQWLDEADDFIASIHKT